VKWLSIEQADAPPDVHRTAYGWAVVDTHTGTLLREGGCIDEDRADQGLSRDISYDWGEFAEECPTESGLWVWVGRLKGVVYDTIDGREYDTLYIGAWRKLNDAETLAQFQDEGWEPEGWRGES